MADHKEKTVRIYTGPVIMVEALASRLEDAGIVPIVRDDQQSAVMFGSGSNYADQLRIFVREDELALAEPIVIDFLSEVGAND